MGGAGDSAAKRIEDVFRRQDCIGWLAIGEAAAGNNEPAVRDRLCCGGQLKTILDLLSIRAGKFNTSCHFLIKNRRLDNVDRS